MIFRIACLILALILVLTASVHEKGTAILIARVRTWIDKNKASLTKDAMKVTEVTGQEEDILDNKKKWRIIIAMFCVMIILMIFSVISIFTLNKKINSLSVTTVELQKQVLELENK
ncbi:MAG: hypothetical protein K6F99_09155 [Lachnospiraceae bacterium]|nr:hypothetical protein [Lachnospiraceae bacterium]